MKVGSKVLGIAVGQKSVLVAEVLQKEKRFVVTQCGEFIFPEGLALSQPEKLGAAFKEFLRAQGFSTKDSIIGLPAKRLVTRRKEIPAVSSAVAANMLRLQAEGEFSSELDNLVMDYAGTPSTAEATTVLLMATNKVVVDECRIMAETAGLRVHAVTSTTVALGRATSRLPGGDGLVLNLGPNGAELVIQHGQNPSHLRHMNMVGGSEAFGMLAGEIRRTMASIPQNGTPQTLAIWNNGTEGSPQNILAQRLSIPVSTPDVSNLASSDNADVEPYAPAIALALMAMESGSPAVDFLHSRLAAPKEPAMSNKKKLAYGGGILLAGLIAFGYNDMAKQDELLAKVQKVNNANKAKVDMAQLQIRRYNDAANWMPSGPHFISVLADVTSMFPPNSGLNNAVWATELSSGNNINSWELKGNATSQDLATQIVNAMMTAGKTRFKDARLASIVKQPTDGLYVFNISFTYIPAGDPSTASKPATVPATARSGRGAVVPAARAVATPAATIAATQAATSAPAPAASGPAATSPTTKQN